MEIVTRVALAVQRVFGTLAEEIGQQCQLIQRQRVFTASSLAKTLVFGYLHNPRASWEELAEVAATCGASVSPQAIEQRFTPKLVSFLFRLCEAMTSQIVAAEPVVIPLLQRFNGVFLHDSTVLPLPDEYAQEWPGCGGSHGAGQAGLKAQVRLDLSTGQLAAVRLEPGRDPDQKTPLQRVGFPRGSLRIADLGYFCVKTLVFLQEGGVFFLSRIQSGTSAFQTDGQPLDLLAWLGANWNGVPLERNILLGSEARLPCRLVALRVPEEVASRRRQRLRDDARRKGRTPSAKSLAWCEWTIYVTNVEPERISWKEIVVLYRARWQIELLFKLWKSHGCLATPTSGTPHRQLATMLIRLLALILQHWLLLASVWSMPQRSLTKAVRATRGFARCLVCCLDDAGQFEQLLTTLSHIVARTARINTRQRNPSHWQLLQNPDLLTYGLT
jgi:hypothetical protein